jgi:hypothetical protein
LRSLHPQLAIQICELNSLHEQITRLEPCADGNLNTWLIPRRESEILKSRASGMLAPIVAMQPEAISVHAIPQEQEVVLRFRGLMFARWSDGRVRFG